MERLDEISTFASIRYCWIIMRAGAGLRMDAYRGGRSPAEWCARCPESGISFGAADAGSGRGRGVIPASSAYCPRGGRRGL
jgi:hypothetical protein